MLFETLAELDGPENAKSCCIWRTADGITMAFLTLLCVCGSHRNSVIRGAASRLVVSIAESLGPGRVLSGIRDITDKMLCTAAQLMLDSSAEAR